MSVDPADPGRGDVAGILAAAAQRTRKATSVRDAEREVAAAISAATPDVWAGHARTSFGTAADRVVVELRGLAERWDAEAAALTAYARGVQEVKDQQLALAARREDAQEDLVSLRWRHDGAQSELQAAPTGDIDDAQARTRALDASIADAGAQLAAIQREWESLAEHRDRVNRECIAALSSSSVLGPLALAARSRNGYANLRDLSATDLLVLARTDPNFASRLARTDPAEVAPWWAALTEADQSDLIATFPAAIGNLEGVSYRDRDRANRVWLKEQLADARKALAAAEEPASFWELATGGEGAGFREALSVAAARERLEGLEGIERALKTPPGTPSRYLVTLTGDSPPLAAVSVGDLDSADVASWAVPGMGSSAAELPGWALAAQRLVQEQDDVDPGASHAVVAWVGYEAPAVGAPSVLDTDLAAAGAVALERALVGFSATREGALLNVVGHSYGTTTSALALVRPGVHVDVVVNLASAGLPAEVDRASDLHADQVFAGEAQDVWAIDPAPGDQWAWVGRSFGNHPVDPTREAFGADVFGVDTGVGGASVTDHGTSTDTGTGYLDRGTESLRNVALATTGSGDRVTDAIDHEPTPFQRALIEGMSGAH